jgi:hypothetical protein
MYLNGNRFKAAAHVRHLTLEDLQQRGGLPAEQVKYYWDYPVTVTNQHDADALAHLLQVEADLLLVHGVPKYVTLRLDKFGGEDDDNALILKKPPKKDEK